MRGYALRGQLDSDPYCHKLHQQSKTQVLLFLICAGLEIPVPLLGGVFNLASLDFGFPVIIIGEKKWLMETNFTYFVKEGACLICSQVLV